jgi:hypothetical protein
VVDEAMGRGNGAMEVVLLPTVRSTSGEVEAVRVIGGARFGAWCLG